LKRYFGKPVTIFLNKQKQNLSVLFKQTAFLCPKLSNIAAKTCYSGLKSAMMRKLHSS